VVEEPNREFHGGKARFQVDQFHKLDPIARDVQQFLGNRFSPRGDRVSTIWDDAEELEELDAAGGMGGEDDEDGYPEGAESYRNHKTRERNRKVVELAKLRRFSATGRLECDACSFDFLKFYGERGRGFIEAHHTLPFASQEGPTEVRIKDFALVCSNCHRMLHRMNPLMTAGDLKRHLAAISDQR
jgi:5-methylcytosine-specific restriction protein A